MSTPYWHKGVTVLPINETSLALGFMWYDNARGLGFSLGRRMLFVGVWLDV
jgi:hypothetical protein